MNKLFPRKFFIIVLITSIWINISEVFRYFVIVMPKMRKDLDMVENVAPMEWFVFLIWGVWDTILTVAVVYISWLCFKSFGNNSKTILISAIVCWITFFLLFWVGMINMNLAKVSLAVIALPLCFLEMLVGSWIAVKLFAK